VRKGDRILYRHVRAGSVVPQVLSELPATMGDSVTVSPGIGEVWRTRDSYVLVTMFLIDIEYTIEI